MSSTFEVVLTSEILLQLASHFSKEPGTCLLYSGSDYDTAERSFLFLFPFETIEISDPRQGWEQLIEHMDSAKGWVGFLGYEMGASSDLEKQLKFFTAEIPHAYFQRSQVSIIYHHKTQRATVTCLKEELTDFSAPAAFEYFLKSLKSLTITVCPHSVHITETLDTYTKKVDEVKTLIRNGDIYQVNLSHQIVFKGDTDPFSLFYRLLNSNPAPFSAFFCLQDYAIVSSSPERFLQKRGNILETRPIKGTFARGKTALEDSKNKESLLASEKNRAELLMITDLMRNDLGKVSSPGTVTVEKLVSCESYANVFHLLSVIRSKARSLHPLNIIRACFPGGSVTGCPKLKAMEVIAQLEQRPRGIYTGSIGYISEQGDFDFNVAIRTLVLARGVTTLQLGGAIIADSEARQEYEETLVKGLTVFDILKGQEIPKVLECGGNP